MNLEMSWFTSFSRKSDLMIDRKGCWEESGGSLHGLELALGFGAEHRRRKRRCGRRRGRGRRTRLVVEFILLVLPAISVVFVGF